MMRPYFEEAETDGILMALWTGSEAWWQPDGNLGRRQTLLAAAGIIPLGIVVCGLHWASWRLETAPSRVRSSADLAKRGFLVMDHKSNVTAFRVRVSGGRSDWIITIEEANGAEYAKVLCADLDTALRMALPYMASMVMPRVFDLPSTAGS